MNLASGTQSAMFANIILFTSRLLLAWIFVHEGAFLATNFDAASAGMGKIGIPALLLVPTIALQLVAGIAIAVGWHARFGAAALGLFCLSTPRFCFTQILPTEMSYCISRRTSPSPAECLY